MRVMVIADPPEGVRTSKRIEGSLGNVPFVQIQMRGVVMQPVGCGHLELTPNGRGRKAWV